MKIHMCKKGDTLYELSKKYHVELDKLIAANPQIANPDKLEVGMKIRIPSGTVPVAPPPAGTVAHIVQQGETLWKLSKQHNISLKTMIDANPQLKNPNILMTGETIYIPKSPDWTPSPSGGIAHTSPMAHHGTSSVSPIEGAMPHGKKNTAPMPVPPEVPAPLPEMIEQPEAAAPLPAPVPAPAPAPAPAPMIMPEAVEHPAPIVAPAPVQQPQQIVVEEHTENFFIQYPAPPVQAEQEAPYYPQAPAEEYCPPGQHDVYMQAEEFTPYSTGEHQLHGYPAWQGSAGGWPQAGGSILPSFSLPQLPQMESMTPNIPYTQAGPQAQAGMPSFVETKDSPFTMGQPFGFNAHMPAAPQMMPEAGGYGQAPMMGPYMGMEAMQGAPGFAPPMMQPGGWGDCGCGGPSVLPHPPLVGAAESMPQPYDPCFGPMHPMADGYPWMLPHPAHAGGWMDMWPAMGQPGGMAWPGAAAEGYPWPGAPMSQAGGYPWQGSPMPHMGFSADMGMQPWPWSGPAAGVMGGPMYEYPAYPGMADLSSVGLGAPGHKKCSCGCHDRSSQDDQTAALDSVVEPESAPVKSSNRVEKKKQSGAKAALHSVSHKRRPYREETVRENLPWLNYYR